MKIGVLVKQVPGSESTLKVNPDGTWVDEGAINFEMNESDSYALEEALQIRENTGDGEVVALSMGPAERTTKVIREALSKGADRGIHIIEEAPYETDPFRIASLFSQSIQDEQFDLILSGLQSDDMGFGQTGVLLGEMLGMSTATLVMETDLKDGSIRVKRELEGGWFQWTTLTLPASITIQSGINTRRYPSLKGIMGAKKKEIKTVDKADLNLDSESMQSFDTVYVPKTDKKTEMIEGDVDAIVQRLIEVFKSEIKVL